MTDAFHVTSSLNRASIHAHGLDYTRMGLARGIAGSVEAEQAGCFLAMNEHERDWFVGMNNTGGPVDVWEVADVDVEDLVESPEGHLYLPGVVPPGRLRLAQLDLPPRR